MQIKKLVLSAAIALTFGLGADGAFSEQCNGSCQFTHPFVHPYPFIYKTDACSMADCYPVPEHSHRFFMPRSIEPGPGIGEDAELETPTEPLIGLSAIAKHSGQNDKIRSHGHSHGHGHGHEHSHRQDHQPAGVPAASSHHHGKVLQDQPFVLIDANTGEYFVFDPRSLDLEAKAAQPFLGPVRFDSIDLQSVHIVDFCQNGDPTNCERAF